MRVVVKSLRESVDDSSGILRSSHREVDVLNRMSGRSTPHLVRPEVVREDGWCFIAVDFFEGAVTVAQAFDSDRLSARDKVVILIKSADAVQTLHQDGFVHCDLKPTNILWSADRGEIRLVDFGAAHPIGPIDPRGPVTFTYAYAPPELRSGVQVGHDHSKSADHTRVIVRDVGPWIDVYALGIMLVQALDPGLWRIGRFEELAVMTRLLVAPELKAVARKAIAIDPTQRYSSALQFSEALSAALLVTTKEGAVG